MIARRMRLLAYASGLFAGLATPAWADATEDFFKTKAVTLVVGYSAGGGFDIYARSFTKFLRNHLPGAPNVIVQNMPGAGSLTAQIT